MAVEDIVIERLEYLRRLEMAGISQPDLDLGPPVIFWIKTRDGIEAWEILPRWVAELLVSDLHNDLSIARACIYGRLPPSHKKCPWSVIARWYAARTGKPLPGMMLPNLSTQDIL